MTRVSRKDRGLFLYAEVTPTADASRLEEVLVTAASGAELLDLHPGRTPELVAPPPARADFIGPPDPATLGILGPPEPSAFGVARPGTTLGKRARSGAIFGNGARPGAAVGGTHEPPPVEEDDAR